MDEIQKEQLNGIYKDMAEILDIQVVLKLYENYKGLQVTFPIRLLSNEYIKKSVHKEYNGNNSKELARKYEYSERWVKKMIKDMEGNGG